MDAETIDDLADADEVEIVGVCYSIGAEAIVILFRIDGGKQGRVLIQWTNFLSAQSRLAARAGREATLQ